MAGILAGTSSPANERRKPRAIAAWSKNQNGKRQCVVIIRERDGKTLPAVFQTRRAKPLPLSATGWSWARKSWRMRAQAWNDLARRGTAMKRINHQEAYSLAGACTNGAEEFFSRMRRAEIGHHHHIAGACT